VVVEESATHPLDVPEDALSKLAVQILEAELRTFFKSLVEVGLADRIGCSHEVLFLTSILKLPGARAGASVSSEHPRASRCREADFSSLFSGRPVLWTNDQ
jgi:hypothetical protein